METHSVKFLCQIHDAVHGHCSSLLRIPDKIILVVAVENRLEAEARGGMGGMVLGSWLWKIRT